MILFVNYVGKMRGYPQFSFWISITFVKIYIPCVIINRGKNTIELVGTVLNRQQYVSLNSIESSKQTMPEMRYTTGKFPWLGLGLGLGLGLRLVLLLVYINDISNCSDKLNFRIFADDTNVYASSPSIRDLEKLINEELAKIKEWCNLNKLSINIKKTNYMIVKSPKKKSGNINIRLPNKYGNSDIIEKRDHIKYLGVLLDEQLSWKHHVAYVCSRIAGNTGIFSKLRHYMSLAQLKRLYYSLVYPYISYASLGWGSGYKTQIKKVQIKQNTVIRTIFFATTRGKDTESAFPFMNLLDILSVTSIFKLQALKFAHRWHSKALPNIFYSYFQYASDIHTYNTRYASNKNFYKPCTRTNTGKQSVSSTVVDLWQDLPTSLKSRNTFTFSGKVKEFLLKTQFRK